MATLHSFRALRPKSEFVEQVACVPYDVVSIEEARAMAVDKPTSFLHVIRPEVDLGKDVDEHASEVYDRGASNLRAFINSPYFVQEDEPSVYIYRLVMDGRPQTGIFACVSVVDYDSDVILKHEKTRPDKEDDRTRHILTQQAHAEPVMLTFKSTDAISSSIEAVTELPPLYDFTASDGVRHIVWRAPNADSFITAFDSIPHLYVADGHHRCKAASRAAQAISSAHNGSTTPSAEYAYFPAVLFPLDQMRILAYNRVIYRLPDGQEAFEQTLRERFPIAETDDPIPGRPGQIRLYLNGRWLAAALPPPANDSAVARLDVARLGEQILEPMLGIVDPRRDANIGFVGGIRGTAELERLVDSRKAALAISMYPTAIEELVAVSDAGLLMPPKSTWFEPKLRSGLLVHLF
ncbi:MAG TPA: DUF1015 family protein [Rhodothermales bacterium]|nr:DUF1015 family protein [Rhodothermales bacterium]